MTTTPDSTRAVVQRAEKFITTAFPGIDKAGPQWNDLVMTFVAGAMDTVVVSVDAADPDNEALAEEQTRLVWGDIQKASEAYL